MPARAVIIIVDDDERFARTIARLLVGAGHSAQVETSSEHALTVLESEEEFDVIFLDVLMPRPTGEDIYNRLAEIAPARLHRIVFLTGIREFANQWLRSTGCLVIEKDAPNLALALAQTATRYSALPYPRGPHEMPARKPPSHPDLIDIDAEPDDDSGDTTGVTALARNGDILAVKIKHIESKHREHKEETDKRISKLEGHFEEKGMVTEMSSDIKIAKSWIKYTPWLIGAIFTVITTAAGGVAYMIHSAERDHDLQLEQKRHDELLQKTSTPATTR